MMWGGCVYGALCERRSLPFQQSFFWQPEPRLCVSNSDVPILKPDICSKNCQIWSFFVLCLESCYWFSNSQYAVKIWCGFDRASSLICANKMPTRCNRGFYCRSYCLLNMFRTPLCPSSGAQEYYTVVAACGISCCFFKLLVWCGFLLTRVYIA